MKSRKIRSDKGVVRATERDIKALTWIADQYAITDTQLAKVLAKWTDLSRLKSPDSKSLSPNTTRNIIERWLRAGWIERKKILADQPHWIWLSKEAIDNFGLDVSYQEPRLTRLQHFEAVNDVRLYIEGRLGEGVIWISERQINKESPHRKGVHIPDGEVILDSLEACIEVELSRKSLRRLEKILDFLYEKYDAIWYFVNHETKNTIVSQVDKIDPEREVFTIYELDSVHNRGEPIKC